MFINSAFRNRRLIASSVVGFLVLLALFSGPPEFSPGELKIYPKESVLKQASETFEEVFGAQQSIQVVISFDDLNFETALTSLQLLLERIESFPGISGTFSILDFEGLFPFLEIHESGTTRNGLSRISGIPMASGLVSKDHLKTQIIAFFAPESDFDISGFDITIIEYLPGVHSVHSLSEEHIKSSIERNVERDFVLLSLAVCLISVVSIIYFFSTWKTFVVSFFTFVFVGIPPLFLFHLFGIKLNFITVLVFPLVFTLALSDAVHLFCGVAAFEDKRDPIEAAKYSIQLYWIPAGFTSLTTAAALASFTFSEFQELENLALVSSPSVLATYLICFGLAPVVLPLLASSLKVPEFLLRGPDRRTKKQWSYAYQLLFALLVLTGAVLGPKLTIRSDTETYIPRDGKLLESYRFVRENFPEENGIEVMLKPEFVFSNDLLPHPELDSSFDVAFRISRDLKQIPGIGTILSDAQVYDFSKRIFLPPEIGGFLVSQSPFFKRPWHRIRITPKPSVNPEDLFDRVEEYLSKQDGLQERFLHAPSLLFQEADRTLTGSLLRALIWSSLVLITSFLLLARSIRATLAAVWVNLGALSGIVVFLVLAKQSLNTTTSLAAIVSLGIIVDDTVHVLYRMLFQEKIGMKDLIPGLLITSLILILSFLSFSISHFQPTRSFGLLTAGLLGLAFFADVLFLPHYLVDRRKE